MRDLFGNSFLINDYLVKDLYLFIVIQNLNYFIRVTDRIEISKCSTIIIFLISNLHK